CVWLGALNLVTFLVMQGICLSIILVDLAQKKYTLFYTIEILLCCGVYKNIL
ncbi:hypothetical protein ACJX0J_023829, partial [Zea mays]